MIDIQPVMDNSHSYEEPVMVDASGYDAPAHAEETSKNSGPQKEGPPPAYSNVAVNSAYPNPQGSPPVYGYDQPGANTQGMAPVYAYNQGASYPPTQTVIVNGHVQPPYSAVTPIVASCIVFWCCNWLFGCIAFFMALEANQRVVAGDYQGAKTLGRNSIIVSVVGAIIGIVVIIAIVIYVANNACYEYDQYGDCVDK